MEVSYLAFNVIMAKNIDVIVMNVGIKGLEIETITLREQVEERRKLYYFHVKKMTRTHNTYGFYTLVRQTTW